ncbi:ArsR/SmtB family transcription factor [Modicisalibacter tunisiensis]|uniref:Helix-turn-helix transcriptional regulator n=1 Tax=Modicisalibacter tunisiensis TaxID=390637 RepID=A0ABS7WX54_9GAMM|nr:helix-turn-helix transcriptional regulator [Modicisalibacter tunisiensis]MBZ9539798.1 helix-turn-helix transcriptional regulator [Modicisalibacter tunisiensis]MBZ9566813.1 helix-turn-helix transcriptional regulator [Modicisalibacter tunisiensis]
MDDTNLIETFTALSQPTRLAAFRLLVRHEPDGLPAGEIARRLDVPHNTLSTHLGVLSRAGLVIAQRRSRSIVYRADLAAMRDTLGFLVNDCCAGRPELCEALQPACPTDTETPS